tara:strand:+ start:85 stop:741 length:657 start_codon:yes stop_codon:yes gene_type:complete
MNIDYSKFENIRKFNNYNQKIIVINGFIKKSREESIYNSLNKSFKNPTKIFKHKEKIVKYEFNDNTKYNKDFKNFYKELNSKFFLNKLEKIFNINKLYSDKNKLYSGLNVSNKNSKLNEHVDFNYNDTLKKYRSINLLLYLNTKFKKSDGGRFYYREFKNKKRKYIDPIFNTAVIFLTNANTPHGFTKTNKKRVSLNVYYYTKQNLSLSKKKHKTYWK